MRFIMSQENTKSASHHSIFAFIFSLFRLTFCPQAVEVAAAASAALDRLRVSHDPALASLSDALNAQPRRSLESIASALAAAESGTCQMRQ